MHSHAGSVVEVQGLSFSAACGNFLDQGSNRGTLGRLGGFLSSSIREVWKYNFLICRMAVLVAQMAKNLPQCRRSHLIPEWGRSLGKGNGNPLQYSCLENSTDRGAWKAIQPMGSQRVRLSDQTTATKWKQH